MRLQQIISSQANAEVPVNENFEALEYLAVYAKKASTTTGLVWGYYGGYWQGFTISDGTITLTASQTNYVVVNRTTGAISVSTNTTNWANTTAYARVYTIVTGTSTVTSVQDFRLDKHGIYVSYTQNFSQLQDVNLTGVQSGQAPVYNSTTSKWEPKYAPAATALPTVNYSALVYNTTTLQWEPRALPKVTVSTIAPASPQLNDVWISY